MYLHSQQLIDEIVFDEQIPLPPVRYRKDWVVGSARCAHDAVSLLEHEFPRDAASKPYKDLLQGVGTEEISHVELIGTTISQLLGGSPGL